MSEQGNEFELDVEGHKQGLLDDDAADVEGHKQAPLDGPDDDVEGHRQGLLEDIDDVEGHRFFETNVQPPRDADLGGTER
jgi:hypothetical protein